MSSDCEPSAQHQLGITLSLKGILSIKFPHREWATTFLNFISESKGEKNTSWNPYISDRESAHSCYVRMNLQGAVNRVQFQGTNEHGGSVIFAFENVSTAQEWFECCGLWLKAGGDKLELRSRWSHEEFESSMKLSNEGENGNKSKKGSEGKNSISGGKKNIFKGKDVVWTSSPSGATVFPEGFARSFPRFLQ